MVGIRRKQRRTGSGKVASAAAATAATTTTTPTTTAAAAAGSLMAVLVAVLVLCCALPVSGELKPSLSVVSPFDKHDHKGSRIIPYWEKTGSTNILQTFVRMTPDKPDNTGTLWSRSPIGSSEFSLEWKFRISGSESTMYGDTFAIILSPVKYKANQPGRFFGYNEEFTGMALVVNTNRNLISRGKPGEPSGRHRDVSVVLNNGTRNYDELIAGMEGCTANVRFDERRDDFNVMQASRVRLKVDGSTLAMEVDARNSGRWRRCATMAHLDMPPDWVSKCNVGIIAQTSENTNNQDLLYFKMFTGAQDAWDVDADDDDVDELDSLVHHMEHEIFNVHDSLQDTINSIAAAEEEAERRLEELEASLSRNLMKALETRVAKLEVQVQTSVSRSLNKHVDQVYGRLEEDVGGKLAESVGKMSAAWRWPFYGLLGIVAVMVAVASTKYKQLKKQHLL